MIDPLGSSIVWHGSILTIDPQKYVIDHKLSKRPYNLSKSHSHKPHIFAPSRVMRTLYVEGQSRVYGEPPVRPTLGK